MILDGATAKALEAIIVEDLRYATIDTVSVAVGEDGSITADEFVLKTEDGRFIGINGVLLEVYTEKDGWTEADVMQDYRQELAVALSAREV